MDAAVEISSICLSARLLSFAQLVYLYMNTIYCINTERLKLIRHQGADLGKKLLQNAAHPLYKAKEISLWSCDWHD